MNINIASLSQHLVKTLNQMGKKELLKRANRLKIKIDAEGKKWLLEIRSSLSINRKNLKGMFKRYNFSNTPRLRTGHLMHSLRYYSRIYMGKDVATIHITRYFDGSKTPTKGYGSYGDILNESSRYPHLNNYKERAYDKLDKRIRELI